MADIDKLIKDLQSKNPKKRYEACEELRFAPLPDEVLVALRNTTEDPDPLVADAANRALEFHKIHTTSLHQNENENHISKQRLYTVNEIILFISLSAITAFFSSFIVFSRSEGYAEASRWVPIAPIFLVIISLGASALASLVSFVIITKSRVRKGLALNLLLSLVTGFIIGIIAGFICNIWQ